MELSKAGSELVRFTVQHLEMARAVMPIRKRLDDMGLDIPLIGDFHYNGHELLTKVPECADALDKYRINPGNVGFGEKHDANFKQMIDVAKDHDKPVRIGVNWGSLDQTRADQAHGRQPQAGRSRRTRRASWWRRSSRARSSRSTRR